MNKLISPSYITRQNNSVTIVKTIKVALITWLLTCGAIAQANIIRQTDNLIKEWLSIEQQRNAMINDWHQQKPLLEQRLVLLKQEQTQLEKNLKTARVNDTDVEKKRAQLISSQNDMEAAEGQLESSLVRYYQFVSELQNKLPPPVQKSWRSKLAESEFQNADTTQRLNTLLELLEQLNDYQNRISHVQSALVLPTKSGDKEMMVHQVYLGLSQAWYVSLDGSLVGRGQPSDIGWQWLADETVDGETVLNAIAMMERKVEANFVQLPISLAGTH
ncbi:MAG: DUF3450 family protein [Colwellia sp.]